MTERENINHHRIANTVSRYFKSQGIKQREVAGRLGVSLQSVSNTLSTRRFTEASAETWAREFGFRKEFLIHGTGRLLNRETGYTRIVKENDELRTKVMRQQSELNRYHALYGPLAELNTMAITTRK